MQCSCGGNAPMRAHDVETLVGAERWAPKATEDDLPVTVYQWECVGCGKSKYEAHAQSGKVLYET